METFNTECSLESSLSTFELLHMQHAACSNADFTSAW